MSEKDKNTGGGSTGFADYVRGRERTLCLPWMSVVGLRLTEYKYTLAEVYRSPEIQLEISKLMDEEFDIDFAYPMDDGSLWAETAGIPQDFPDYDFPSVTAPIVHTVEDVAALKVFDPWRDGRMPDSLEALKLIGRNSDKPLATTLEGPFTFAGKLAGISRLGRAILREPDFVVAVTDYAAEVVARYAEAAVECGLKFLSIAEPTAILLSPDQFERFVVKGVRKVFSRVKAWKALHVCGNSIHLMDKILDCGAEGLSLDQLVDLPSLAPRISSDIVLFGNIDPINVLGDLPADKVYEHTAALMKRMAPHPNFIMSTGCDCLPNTPFENIKAMVRATRDLSGR